MNAAILHIDECPSWVEAGRRFEQALRESGFNDIEIEYHLLSNPADAARTPFAGSPTLLLDGADLFPSDGRTSDLACRIYPTPDGLAGLPTTTQIIKAIESAGHGTRPLSQ